jgi:hypothetical protein
MAGLYLSRALADRVGKISQGVSVVRDAPDRGTSLGHFSRKAIDRLVQTRVMDWYGVAKKLADHGFYPPHIRRHSARIVVFWFKVVSTLSSKASREARVSSCAFFSAQYR